MLPIPKDKGNYKYLDDFLSEINSNLVYLDVDTIDANVVISESEDVKQAEKLYNQNQERMIENFKVLNKNLVEFLSAKWKILEKSSNKACWKSK